MSTSSDSCRTRALEIKSAQGLGLQQPGCVLSPETAGSLPALQPNPPCPQRRQELEISNPELEPSGASPLLFRGDQNGSLTHSRPHHQFQEELGLEPRSTSFHFLPFFKVTFKKYIKSIMVYHGKTWKPGKSKKGGKGCIHPHCPALLCLH